MCCLTIGTIVCAASLDKARELYQRTDYDGALAILDAIPANTKDAAAWHLTGEALFHKDGFKHAADAFERAVMLDAGNSRYVHALGRAYGRQAESANPLMAPRYAVKTRQAFEKAVALDSSNIEALNDLLEYYLDAPGFLGGGLSRAEELLPRISKLDAAEGHFARAQIALKRKDLVAAEREFRAAMNVSPSQTGRILDLAKFLDKQGRPAEADPLYTEALKPLQLSPSAVFARAESYIRRNRNLPEAASLLEKYLGLALTPEDPSRSAAMELLGKARQRNGQSH